MSQPTLCVQTETVEEPIEEDEAAEVAEKPAAEDDEDDDDEDDDDAVVEEEEEKEDKPKTKMVEKTTWDWVLVNDSKPIWLRR